MKRTIFLISTLIVSVQYIKAQTNTPPLPNGNTKIGEHLNVGASNEVWSDASSLYFNYRGNAVATHFWNLGGTTGNSILSLLNSGNVGIGTTNPYTKLDIVGTGGITNFTGSSFLGLLVRGSNNAGTDYSGIDFSGYSSDYYNKPLARIGVQVTPQGTFMRFGTSNNYSYGITNSAMSIDYSGNVGIGTATPNTKFHVQSGITEFSNGAIDNNEATQIYFSATGYQTSYLHKISTAHSLDVNQGWMKFSLASGASTYNDVMILKENGNVGIGTTNPLYKLAVKGTIGCGEVKVEVTSGWADFVFHPNYKLRTLGEVEQFIKTNNHLPEIPTEKEVKENGIGLGEMNAKLLQKIEELTLYLIQKDKENRVQDEKINLLEQEILKLKEK